MNIYNPYVAAIASGLIVYLYMYKTTEKNKQNKQTNLNYVFLSSLIAFVGMHYYANNSIISEPTLTTKFDD